jgi:hypothetical protein
VRRGRVGSSSRVAAIVAVAFAVVACLDAPVASVVPTPTRAPEPTATTSSYTLDTTVWYEGLVLTFGRVTAELDQLGGPVTVSIHIENPGADLGELDAQIALVLGETVVAPTRDSHVPSIPAGGIADVVLEYDVQGFGSIADGVIQVGADPFHLGVVPITAPADATTLEPKAFSLSASGAAGGLRLRLRKGLLRWDLPDWSEELDAKSAALTLTYDVTYTGTFPGGYAFTADNVILRLPNGTSVAPRRDGRSQSVELIGPGKTKVNLFSRFIVPSGLPGQYRLILRDGSAQKAIAFTIPA